MSKTDKDAPFNVMVARMADLEPCHYGCPYADTPAYQWLTHEVEHDDAWVWVELVELTCCSHRLVDEEAALKHLRAFHDESGSAPVELRLAAMPRRAVTRWVPAHTERIRERILVERYCDIEAGTPRYGWGWAACSLVPWSYALMNRGDGPPTKADRGALYWRPARRAVRQALREARDTRGDVEPRPFQRGPWAGGWWG